jgi:7,8-dihydropterin-6-yl-methyl-4-(beta-D-ribofuranosyl)aminobenzene 5'-phosphate synthase
MNTHRPNLKILVDNAAGQTGLQTEHGFSLLIETGGKTILFDAGQETALENNARTLAISLQHIDAFVLSHGHCDHTGAVDFVLQENPAVPVYAHPAIFSERYSLHSGQPPREISMPSEERLIVANLPDSQLNWIRKPTPILPGVWLTGPIPRVHPLENTGGPFFTDPEGKTPDPITDDMALWIETIHGLLIVCGCCHSGLINTVNHIRQASGEARIFGIIGGLHLKNASADRLAATTDALRESNPEFIVPCHCTGEAAIAHFHAHLNTRIISGFAGFEFASRVFTSNYSAWG